VTCPIGALAADATATAQIVVDTIDAGDLSLDPPRLAANPRRRSRPSADRRLSKGPTLRVRRRSTPGRAGNRDSSTIRGGSRLSATATVSGDEPDPVPANDSATEATVVAMAVKATPTLVAAAAASVPAGSAIADAATLAGGHDATGTIAFDVYGPGDAACATSLAGSTASVSGDGTYASAPFVATTAGTYRWVARYGGDVDNEAAGPTACGDPAQAVVVTKASPSLAVHGSPLTVAGAQVGAVAVLEGGAQPTGTLTFRVYGDTSCTTPLQASTTDVAAAGAFASAPFAPPGPGTYRWAASYSGDANNAAAGPGACGGAESAVAATSPQLPAVGAYATRAALTIGSASSSVVVARCPAGSALTGGGGLVARPSAPAPSNSLKLDGTLPGEGDPLAGDPAAWTAVAAFGGQSEPGDDATAYALCAGAPPGRHVAVAAATSAGDAAATSAGGVTATCPAGTRLTGGGALGTPASAVSLRPVASFPSDALGRAALDGARDPGSWTAIAAAPNVIAGAVTRAFALCSDDPALHTTVARRDAPGPQTQSASVALTTTCPGDTRLLGGGARLDASGAAPPQGVHLRGSFPSSPEGVPVAAGTPDPGSWAAVAQAGPQDSPGTSQRVFALCATRPPAAAPPPPAPGPAPLLLLPPPPPAAATPPAPARSSMPTPAQLAASLRRQMAPTRARISTLLGRRGLAMRFTPLVPGRVAFAWYRPAASRAAKPILIARGMLTFARVRTATVRVKPTSAGRRLLRRATRAHVLAKGTFTPAGARAVTASQAFVLRR